MESPEERSDEGLSTLAARRAAPVVTEENGAVREKPGTRMPEQIFLVLSLILPQSTA